MGLLFAALGFGLLSMLVIEAIPPDWRKAIGGAILLIALIAGSAAEY